MSREFRTSKLSKASGVSGEKTKKGEKARRRKSRLVDVEKGKGKRRRSHVIGSVAVSSARES